MQDSYHYLWQIKTTTMQQQATTASVSTRKPIHINKNTISAEMYNMIVKQLFK